MPPIGPRLEKSERNKLFKIRDRQLFNIGKLTLLWNRVRTYSVTVGLLPLQNISVQRFYGPILVTFDNIYV